MARNIKAKKIVIKIGTNTITDKSGLPDLKVMQNLISQISKIKNKNKDVVIITSGAIGAGMRELGLKEKPKDVVSKQVCAGIGQILLMANYHAFFKRHNIKIAQILLSYADFSNKRTYSNLSNSLNKMLELGVIPIINENDPISIDEIGPSFGDNDNLSAIIASRIKADLLVILTDVDGLYTKNPKNKDAVLVKEVKRIDRNIERMAGQPGRLGVGGMKSKINAAKMATDNGVTVVVANGKISDTLIDIMNNKDTGTIFFPKKGKYK